MIATKSVVKIAGGGSGALGGDPNMARLAPPLRRRRRQPGPPAHRRLLQRARPPHRAAPGALRFPGAARIVQACRPCARSPSAGCLSSLAAARTRRGARSMPRSPMPRSPAEIGQTRTCGRRPGRCRTLPPALVHPTPAAVTPAPAGSTWAGTTSAGPSRCLHRGPGPVRSATPAWWVGRVRGGDRAASRTPTARGVAASTTVTAGGAACLLRRGATARPTRAVTTRDASPAPGASRRSGPATTPPIASTPPAARTLTATGGPAGRVSGPTSHFRAPAVGRWSSFASTPTTSAAAASIVPPTPGSSAPAFPTTTATAPGAAPRGPCSSSARRSGQPGVGGPLELVHHSDRGSTYASADYRKALDARRIEYSMSRQGDCWDSETVCVCPRPAA
jgi:hypothetical protein